MSYMYTVRIFIKMAARCLNMVQISLNVMRFITQIPDFGRKDIRFLSIIITWIITKSMHGPAKWFTRYLWIMWAQSITWSICWTRIVYSIMARISGRKTARISIRMKVRSCPWTRSVSWQITGCPGTALFSRIIIM